MDLQVSDEGNGNDGILALNQAAPMGQRPGLPVFQVIEVESFQGKDVFFQDDSLLRRR